jgi:hypothetical protein
MLSVDQRNEKAAKLVVIHTQTSKLLKEIDSTSLKPEDREMKSAAVVAAALVDAYEVLAG